MQSLRVLEYYLDESAPVEYVPGEAVTQIIGDQAGELFQVLQVLGMKLFVYTPLLCMQLWLLFVFFLVQDSQLNATVNSIATFVQSSAVQNQLGPPVVDALENAVTLVPDVRNLGT